MTYFGNIVTTVTIVTGPSQRSSHSHQQALRLGFLGQTALFRLNPNRHSDVGDDGDDDF
jgi:hypothetical protein